MKIICALSTNRVKKSLYKRQGFLMQIIFYPWCYCGIYWPSSQDSCLEGQGTWLAWTQNFKVSQFQHFPWKIWGTSFKMSYGQASILSGHLFQISFSNLLIHGSNIKLIFREWTISSSVMWTWIGESYLEKLLQVNIELMYNNNKEKCEKIGHRILFSF